MAVLTVTQLNRYVGFRLKEDVKLQGVLVRGEISNFTQNFRSGHCYFTLRDADSGVRAVMFRTYAGRLKFTPQDGMAVIAAATATLYEKEGSFQLNITDLMPDGAGQKAMAQEQLKQKLTAMGVFDSAAKRPLPPMPQRIGVITSASGAAIEDIKNVIARRYPIGTLYLYPTLVQGEQAADSICRAIATAQRDGCDVLIVGRGGGAAEDLQAFQTEAVVLAIYHCTVPIVSAVGHETDWTLADAAADLRAPTPSAAAELAVPDLIQMRQQIQMFRRRLMDAITGQLEQQQQRLYRLRDRLRLHSPAGRQALAQKELELIRRRLTDCGARIIRRREVALQQQVARLDMLSPLKILGRGYALAYHGDTLVRDAATLAPGDTIQIRLDKGSLQAVVQQIWPEAERSKT